MGRTTKSGFQATKQHWDDAGALYQDGVSLNTLAWAYSVSREFTRRHLRAFTRMRKTGRSKQLPTKSHVYFQAHPLLRGAYARVLVIAYERSKLSMAQLAKKFRITDLAVRDMLREQGIDPRQAESHRTTNASQRLNAAVKNGLISRGPCEVCDRGPYEGNKLVVVGHHDDYNYPLRVRWLCEKHHKEWHRNHSPIMADPEFTYEEPKHGGTTSVQDDERPIGKVKGSL